jgi:hypothetical protein
MFSKFRTGEGGYNFVLFYFFILSFQINISLKEEAQNLSTDVLLSRLFVVHDTRGRCKDDVSELTGGEDVGSPLLQLLELDIIAWADNTALVDASIELNDNLAGAAVIYDLELTNVTL